MDTPAVTAPVLLITHLPEPALGMWPLVLTAFQLPVVHRNLYRDALPTDLEDVSAIVSLGGQISVIDIDSYEFLVEELELIRMALVCGKPTFGLCLGAQLLARAAGGRVMRMPQRYIGWPELTLTRTGVDDVLFGQIPTGLPVIKWHADGIDAPAASAVLATTDTPGCAVFRVGECAWGSQMHLEADPAMLFERWLPDPAEVKAMRRSAWDPKTFTEQCRRHLPAQVAAMRPVLERFAEYVIRRQTAPAALARDPAAPRRARGAGLSPRVAELR
jgi:GMP synthase (glutamine-hydrolysing)